jgi:hypothetical protein
VRLAPSVTLSVSSGQIQNVFHLGAYGVACQEKGLDTKNSNALRSRRVYESKRVWSLEEHQSRPG